MAPATSLSKTNKHGRLLTKEKEQEVRWAEHFKEILNRPPPTIEADMQGVEDDLDMNTDPPDKEEIIAAIKNLKNGKTLGQDNLNAELFKANPELSAKILTASVHCSVGRQAGTR